MASSLTPCHLPRTFKIFSYFMWDVVTIYINQKLLSAEILGVQGHALDFGLDTHRSMWKLLSCLKDSNFPWAAKGDLATISAANMQIRYHACLIIPQGQVDAPRVCCRLIRLLAKFLQSWPGIIVPSERGKTHMPLQYPQSAAEHICLSSTRSVRQNTYASVVPVACGRTQSQNYYTCGTGLQVIHFRSCNLFTIRTTTQRCHSRSDSLTMYN